MDIIQTEHDDLEEKIQISAKVDFSESTVSFEGLDDIQIEIKKKSDQHTKIENIEFRKQKSRNNLF